MSNQNTENAALSTVQVRAAAPGSQVVVDASGAARIAFDFDIASANMSRSGNDLLFETDNGGSVRITGFFAPADGMNLPEFVLADNTVVDSKDLLAAYDIDATPAAAAAPGGGLGAYNSDPGSLIGGLDASSNLDPFFWGPATGRSEDYTNNRYPGGSFDLSISTDLGVGAFSAVVYEDAAPYQNMGNSTLMAGQIHMNITPNSGSTVGEIRFSGLPAGAALYLGDPANGGTQVYPDANGVYHFSASNFTSSGVYIIPPADSDADIRINVSVDFSDSGRVATVNGGFTVIVDAVADLPYNVVSDDIGITNELHSMSSSTVESDFVDGYNKHEVTVRSDAGEGKVHVTLEVTSQFSDYDPADGSEAHYVLVELPDGFTPAGNYQTYTDPADGRVYIMVPADGAIDPSTGLATVAITLETESYDADTNITLKTGAMSVESATDKDFDLDNDVSVTIPGEVNFSLDVVDAALNISMGWGSEGNNASGYLGSGAHTQNFGNMNDDYSDSGSDDGVQGLDNSSTNSLGAPIVIELDGASGTGSANTITEVVLTLEPGRGVLVDGNGNVIQPDGGTGNTYTFSGDISAGEVYFQPNAGSYDDEDVSIGYQVTVTNGEDATAIYTGTANVVVDAVADFAPVSNLDADYGSDSHGAMSAAKPGGEVELKMDVNFPDTTAGNENHYVLIAAGVSNIDAYGICTITDAAGNMTPITVDLSTLSPNADGYYEILVPSSVSDVEVSVKVTVSDSLTTDTTIPVGMGSKTEVIEPTGAANKEYDSENNTSINVSDVDVKVAPANSSGAGSATGTYETDAAGNVLPNKHGVTGTLTVKEGAGDIIGKSVNAGDMSKLGDITFALNNSDGDSAEHFTKIQFTIDGDLADLGTLTLEGTAPGDGVTMTASYDSNTGLTTVTITDSSPSEDSITVNFTPKSYSDTDLKIMDYELEFINAESHAEGKITEDGAGSPVVTVVVDAVAAKATVENITSQHLDYVGGQTQAKAGEEVKVTFAMTVPETVGDATETHGLTLKDLGNDGYNSVTLFGGSTDPLVITFDDPNPSTLGSTAPTVYVNDVASTDFTVTVISIKSGTGATNFYYKISGPGFESYLDEVGGNISGEISLNASSTATGSVTNGDYSASTSVGLLITDDVSDNSDSTTQNNVSYSEKAYTYQVGGVASTVSMAVGNAYENAAKDANGGFVSRADLLAALGDSDPAVAADALARLKAGSASITISGAASDESITKAVFVADYPDAASASGDDLPPGQFMYQGVLIDVSTGSPVTVDGVTITCELGADGQVTITLEGNNIDLGAGNLYFVPGENYNHNDVTVNYGITVTDNESGQDKVFASDHDNPALFPADTTDLRPNIDYDPNEGNSSVIKVDAVAQRPDITNVSIEVLNQADPNTIAHGETAQIKIDVDLHGDLDGTEGRIFYVKTAGNDYPVESVIITYVGTDGSTYSIEVLASSHELGLQQTNLGGEVGTANYHKVDIDAVINASGKPPLGDSEITITVNVGTPGSGSGSEVSFGLSSHEDWYEVRQGWENGSNDTELSKDNNTAWTSGSVDIHLSSAGTPRMSLGAEAFYENNNSAANEGEYAGGAGVPLGLSFGDTNDILTDFNVSLNGENAALGDLILFDSEASYNEFVTAVNAANNDQSSPHYGKTAHEILEQDFAGKAQNMGDEITFGDIENMVGKNGNGELTGGFTGKIVFMPSEDSYSGQDPDIDYSITVRDSASGEVKTGSSSVTPLADAVAQKPDTPELSYNGSADINPGGERTVTITATFGDSDDSTEHYILVEAKAGWTLSVDGTPLSMGNLETYEEGGTVYYKIPVEPTFAPGSDTGTASIDVTLKAPTNSLYYQNDDGTYSYSFEVRAGSTDKDLRGDELTFHNNTAVSDEGGSLSLSVNWQGGGGDYHFRQTTALYEDNNPDSHVKDDDPDNNSTGGTFSLGAANCDDGYALIECPVTAGGDPIFTIDGAAWDSTAQAWRVELDADGNADITVTLSEEYLAENGGHNDADLHFDKISFYDEHDNLKESIDNSNDRLEVVVDAVADRSELRGESIEVWDSATDANRTDDAVAGNKGGGDATAKFTVNATFPDTTAESHYILVEKIPAWEYDGTADEVYLDGKTYYKIDVTQEVQNGNGVLSYEVGMKYVGATVDEFDLPSWKTDANGDPVLDTGGNKIAENGVTAYDLTYGTMSQEGVSDHEIDLQNNIAINLEGQVTLKYSPITSSVSMTVSHSSNEEGASNNITLKLNEINTEATQDTLINLKITFSPADGSAGELWLVDDQGNRVGNDPILSGHEFSASELALLSTGGYKLVFEQDEYNHQDVSFTWSGTVKDMVSGATEGTSGGVTIVMDAVAQGSTNDYENNTDGSIVVADKDTGATGVQSGNSALVTVKAVFPDTTNVDDPRVTGADGSEEHWVVLEQGDLDYSVLNATVYGANGQVLIADAAVVTKFGPDGTPYFAVQVPAGTDISVVFEVTTPSGLTSDTQIKLNGGTITIENTKNGSNNSEPDYNDNWTANIGQDAVEIQVGVLETDTVTVTAQTNISEGGYSQLSFTGINAAYNEEAEITITELPAGVKLYVSDGSGGYTEVTASPLTITYHNDNGTMVPDQDYYLKADDHYSGNVTIKYTVEVTDVRTGETKSLDEQSASLNIKGVASDSALDDTAYNADQDTDNAHLASVKITPTFTDTDGSEEHYLLFSVPDGMVVNGAVLLTNVQISAFGLAPGTYYRINVDGKSGQEQTINLSSVNGYDAADDSITVWSMSEEKGSNVVGGEKYALSDPSEISVGDLNNAITVGQPHSEDVQAGSDWTVCGAIDLANMFDDPDGDALSYSFNYAGGDYAMTPAGVDIPGLYGTLHIDADGTYTYTPGAGEANDSFHLEEFSNITVTATDGYGSSEQNTVDIGFDALGALYGEAGDDTLTADSAGLTVYGGAGNDEIYAHDDGTVIFGGLGDDTIYAGTGGDVFAWRDGDLDSGIDTIVGFDMTSDKLFIEGLLGGNPADQESELAGLLSEGDLLLSMNDASTLTLQYGDQTVKLELSENVDASTFNTMNDNSGDSDTAKAQLLMSILNTSM